ncbi:HNH endonuclease [Phenylobacterium sp.]|uniref:HNH endonuclease n=1 Tax=Phenylobacterium sp. TaxID=1871053 RepID=UPI0035B194DE
MAAAAWYSANYSTIAHWIVRPTDKVVLGEASSRTCRFCGKSEPEVTFKLEAHAIPEGLGNKSIFSNYECDPCNQAFGRGIENDLGNWSKPMRTFSRIRGKNSVPTLKKGGEAPGWRIEHDDKGFSIKQYEDEKVCAVDAGNKSIRFDLKRDSYTPVAVLKAFVKIGLTLMPEAEIQNFEHAIAWVSDPDHSKVLAEQCPVIYTFIPGPMPNDVIAAFILRRKPGVSGVPYAWVVIGYGNEVFQFIIPSKPQDGSGYPSFQLLRFPTPSLQDERVGAPKWRALDLTGRDVVKGEAFSISLGFDELVERPLPHSAAADDGAS